MYTVLFLLYSVMKRRKNMNYIDLNSVGSTVTSEGLVFPIDCSEAPETASDADEMMGVHIKEVDDEWWCSLTKDECFDVLTFLDLMGVIDTDHTFPEQGADFDWASEKYHMAGTYDELVMEAI